MIARYIFSGALALAVPSLYAQAPADLPAKELTEATQGSMEKLRLAMEAKDYGSCLTIIDGLLPKVSPTSFDTYLLSQIKVQVLLGQNKLVEAIPALEVVLALSEGNPNFYDSKTYLDYLNLLAQLYYQRAAAFKVVAEQKAGYDQALGVLKRWFAKSPTTSPDSRLFAASLLYQIATADGGKADVVRIREAIEQAREGILLSVKPTNQLILLLVACHLQIEETAKAAEFLEMLVEVEPKSEQAWSQLHSIYLASSSDAKDPAESKRLSVRALNTLDRAQKNGILVSTKDNYTRVAILFNLQQFTRAAGLLEKGLSDGSLENSKRNWELLSSAYQQTNKEEKALDAMSRAVAKFPSDGALEFSLAQLLYSNEKVELAYARAEAALVKGLEKPGQAKVYLAYLAYELQRYDDAKKWVDQARAQGDVPAKTLDSLSTAIAEAVRARS
jgi:Tfp pilus assembly protein PilF